ncbi:MAG: CidA/LrgA family protein [Oscillospiraceae bacterium]|nr:CidA/LrgA family protein [Oscillospiraceae bacterium]
MKYLEQLSIIIAVCFAGEVVKHILPLPVPGSIYGMVIMFVLLLTGVLKLDKVEKVSDFLIDCMPLMFVPGGVGLIKFWSTLQSMMPAVIGSIVIVTPFVMIVTGKVTQRLIEKGEKR